jgi:hypothetical protein
VVKRGADLFRVRWLQRHLRAGRDQQGRTQQCARKESGNLGHSTFPMGPLARFYLRVGWLLSLAYRSAQTALHKAVRAQISGVYCAQATQFFPERSALMALKAVEEVAEQVPGDDFQALEEKVYRTIEMYKAARQAQAAAERDAQRLRQQLEDREEQLESLRRDTVQLRKEREEIRGRVEKMLAQIESIAEEQAAS